MSGSESAATLPAVWAEVLGQPRAVALLEAAAASPVHAYLLVGPAGSGKVGAARAFAARLLCPNGGCGVCRDCRLALGGIHPDVHEHQREGAAITVEAAREVVREAMLSPIEGNRKLLVLDEVHLLRPEAAATLLKTVEEPPASTIFVALADDVPPELVTIASRCQRVDLGPIADDVVRGVLVAEGVDAAVADAVAKVANGDLNRARVLAGDEAVMARRDAFAAAPRRLDGSGSVAMAVVDELEALLDGSVEALKARQVEEAKAFETRTAWTKDRSLGAERKRMEDRHKREVRRYRTDELRAGLGVLAGAYRDALVSRTAREPAEAVDAVTEIHGVIESLERNPNETLLLQALLLRLPTL